MTTTSTPLTLSDLNQFTGDMIRYTHPLNRRVIYTPGVRCLAQRARAYWLIEAIASYFGSPQWNEAIENDERLQDLQFWHLSVKDSTAVLTAVADQGEPPFVTQHFPYADFPLEKIDIWAGFDGSHWTLYLPSEH